MNITKRQLLSNAFLRGMIKGAGGEETFDEVLYLFEADPSFAEELGQMISSMVREMEERAFAEDANDAFAREMNEVAEARGLNIRDPRNGILVDELDPERSFVGHRLFSGDMDG